MICYKLENMKFKREIVTPYLVFIFVIVGFTGILMFFHLADGYTKEVHEFLGLAFALFAIMHVTINWKSIKNYADKRLLLAPSIVVLILSITFMVIGRMEGDVESDILDKVLKSPAYRSFEVLSGDYTKAEETLAKNKIIVKDSLQTLEEICIQNQKDPEDVAALIMQ